MVKTLFKMFKKPKNGAELLTELDISRVVGTRPQGDEELAETDAGTETEVDAAVEAPSPEANIQTWKQNDLDLLQMTWQSCCENPDDEDSTSAFRSALHNLHGASGAYGGGALTRLTGSLHELVSGIEDLQGEAALINLHVQACRATSLGDGDAVDSVADAVCDALEHQVGMRLIG